MYECDESMGEDCLAKEEVKLTFFVFVENFGMVVKDLYSQIGPLLKRLSSDCLDLLLGLPWSLGLRNLPLSLIKRSLPITVLLLVLLRELIVWRHLYRHF